MKDGPKAEPSGPVARMEDGPKAEPLGTVTGMEEGIMNWKWIGSRS